jgi:hypothetical protein
LSWCIEGAVYEEIPIFMTFLTSEGDVFVFYGFCPFFLLILYGNKSW